MKRLGWLGVTLSAAVQAAPVQETETAENFGALYAQMLNFSVTPAISAASLKTRDGATLDNYRLPYEFDGMALGGGARLYPRVGATYLAARERDSDPEGGMSSKWTGYGVSMGAILRYPVSTGLTWEPAFDVTVFRMLNDTSYSGQLAAASSALDRQGFNWHTNAWAASPSMAVEWRRDWASGHRLNLRLHVGWSWFASFQSSANVAPFREGAGAYALRLSYAMPTGMRVGERGLDAVVHGAYSGFYGGNRGQLGFDRLAEVGLGIEAPLSAARPQGKRMRASVSYLKGRNISGWGFGLGLRY